MTTTRLLMQRLTPAIIVAVAVSTMVMAQERLEPRAQQEPLAMSDLGPLNQSSDLWFVELSSPPAAEGTGISMLQQEKTSFRVAATRAGIQYAERRAFSYLWNGLSIRLNPSQLSVLTQIPGVKAVYPIAVITRHASQRGDEQISENERDLASALSMTGADVVQRSGITGAGIRVAVIDSGIDYNHPDLGGCFGPGCRVEKGYDLVGDQFSGTEGNPIPSPDPDPDDNCDGHGTHVAGILGASAAGPEGVTGVAPEATFYAYRVFGCQGNTFGDIMMEAMERALLDGAQVVNMSIGSSYQWPEYPTAAASDTLVELGVSVVASIGNSGANGVYSAAAPGVGREVIGVASFDNTLLRFRSLTVSPDDTPITYQAAAGALPPPTSGSYAMARTGSPTSTADACSRLEEGSLSGHVALIRRGTCSFYLKTINAQRAGAVGVVIYNNVPGRIIPGLAPDPPGSPPVEIPVVSITAEDGLLINNRLDAEPVTMTWTDVVVSVPNPTGDLISSFSSYGLSPDLTLKPDLGAPGGFIRSTYPLDLGGYVTVSGTSMSSPHTAGAVALLLQARPDTRAWQIRDILLNSADPRVWSGNPASGLLEPVHRQGAGMLDIPGAIQSTTVVTPAKLALGESEAGPVTRTLTLSNRGTEAVTYALSHVPAVATVGTFPAPAPPAPPPPNALSFFNAPSTVSFSVSTVTVPAAGTATVDVTVEPNLLLPEGGVFNGYIVLTADAGEPVYRVPYAGFKGDYQSVLVLRPTPLGLPRLAKLVGTSFVTQPGGATFTMQGDDLAYILAHLDHQSSRVQLNVKSVETGRIVGLASVDDFVPRNATPPGFFAFFWNGTIFRGAGRSFAVPDGQYQVVLTILKPLGDERNPEHYEEWTSPVITIARQGGLTP